MYEDIDLDYDPSTLVGPLDTDELEEFERFLEESGQPIQFDPAYLAHLSKFHGGVPAKRCFETAEGQHHVIERFLNFLDPKKDETLGWYNVNVTWSQMEDRLNEFLIPFATLFGGDMLCFDYEAGGRPAVVVWLHEESSEDHPATSFVAADFDAFLRTLHKCEETDK
jgi:hypothetical protein